MTKRNRWWKCQRKPATGSKPAFPQKPERFHLQSRIITTYAQATKVQNVPDTETVLNFLMKCDLQVVADTFKIIEGPLTSTDPQRKDLFLVEACQVLGLL